MSTHTEAQLIDRLRNGSQRDEAFGIVVKWYGPRLYHHLLRLLREPADVDDVLQNTFIKAFQNLDRFRGDSKLLTWLYRIATNEALSFLRKTKTRGRDLLTYDEVELAAKDLRAEPHFDGERAQALLLLAIGTLAPKQTAVFSMRYYDELPYAEIHKITGTSIGSLKASYHQATKKIEEFIKLHTP